MEETRTKALELRRLVKNYGSVAAVDGIDLAVEPGEFISLLGPSGSGKTTTLNLIAGFIPPDSGDILVDGVSIRDRPPHRRNLGLVFQNYLLFPHMTAAQNVAFPLKRRGVEKREASKRVASALELVGLENMGSRYPKELSGGQQQRVALARAIVFNPPILLMDEPLGALDKNLREVLQVELRRIHRELGTTFIYVTHDQGEALALSDRIAIFNDGKIEQLGTAESIYESPRTTFVASFVGESNIMRGSIMHEASGATLKTTAGEFALPAQTAGSGERSVLIRPEKVRIGGGAPHCTVTGRLIESVYLGFSRRIAVQVEGIGTFTAYEPDPRAVLDATEPISLSWEVSDLVVLSETGVE